MSRPLLPRASSATSGFFFWGSIELPVAKASSRTAKPNSSVDHSTISSPMRDRCTPSRARSKRASATKSRSDTASSEFSNRPANPRSEAVPSGSRGSDEPARAPGPERATRRGGRRWPAAGRRRGPAPSRGPAGGGPAARAGPAAGGCSPAGRCPPPPWPGSPARPGGRGPRRPATVSSRLAYSRRSVATWSLRLRPGVELGPDVAGQLGHPPLDGGVDVLVVGHEGEGAGVELGLHRVEGVEQDRHLLLGQQPAPAEAAHVGPRAGEVVVGQPPVDVGG